VLSQETGVGFEVIVIDSSFDQTPEIVATEFPSVTLIHLDQKTFPGAARNIGVEHASAEIVAFIDSDCVAASNWLDRIVSIFRSDAKLTGVGGCIGNANPDNLTGWGTYLIEFNSCLPQTPRRLVSMLPTCNAAYKKEALNSVGGFQTEMFGAEDRLLNWALVSKEAALLFEPSIKVNHVNRTGIRRLVAHQFLLGQCMMRARMEFAPDLPGASICQFPLLAPVFWVLRLGRIVLHVARWDRSNMLHLVYRIPLVALGLAAFGLGELRSRWSPNIARVWETRPLRE